MIIFAKSTALVYQRRFLFLFSNLKIKQWFQLPLFPVPANSLDANDGALTINEAENSNEKLLATAEIENGGEIHQQQQETNNDLDQRFVIN